MVLNLPFFYISSEYECCDVGAYFNWHMSVTASKWFTNNKR